MLPLVETTVPPKVPYDASPWRYRMPGVQPAIINSLPNETTIWVDDGRSHDASLSVYQLTGGQPAVIKWTPSEITIWAMMAWDK